MTRELAHALESQGAAVLGVPTDVTRQESVEALADRAVAAFGGAHLVFMGYKGWLNPSGWHGGMPPISLVAFAFFIVGYGANLLGRE